ncbi:MAG: preprotein translocase subunit SecG [Betaproteobacteria bacterium]|nr:MAG: preprotein translocase subunit SecG [Betaproteobacteria bacterium]
MQIISAIAVIVLVLLQHGKGADMGAAFGSGSSGSLFGATIFLLCTLGLAFYSRAGVEAESGGVMEAIQASPAEGTATPAETKPAEPKTPVQDIPK